MDAQRKTVRASVGGGGGGGGGGGLNVRIRLTSARPRSPRPGVCPDPQHPNSRRERGTTRPGGDGDGDGDGDASCFTCDGPGPAVELHGVVQRRGHHVEDTARLRVQEPHLGGKRAPAAERGEEKGRHPGRVDLGGDGRRSERQPGSPLTAAAPRASSPPPPPPGAAATGMRRPRRPAGRRRRCRPGSYEAEEEEETSPRAPGAAPVCRRAPPPLQSPRPESRGRARGGGAGAPPPARALGLLRRDAAAVGPREPGPRRRAPSRTSRLPPFPRVARERGTWPSRVSNRPPPPRRSPPVSCSVSILSGRVRRRCGGVCRLPTGDLASALLHLRKTGRGRMGVLWARRRGNPVKEHAEKVTICKLRKKASLETNPARTLILDFWPPRSGGRREDGQRKRERERENLKQMPRPEQGPIRVLRS
ncbi:uncharacterized protein LOC144316693 [Canis aureus]